MRVWHIHLEEALPLESCVRPGPSANLTRELVKLGHEVTWWSSSFSSRHRQELRAGDSEEWVKGVKIRMLATPGFSRQLSVARWHYHRHFARRFTEQAEASRALPHLLWATVPGMIECDAVLRFGAKHEIPVLVELRDAGPSHWIEDRQGWSKPLARVAATPIQARLASIYRRASALTASSKEQLAAALQLAGRAHGPHDRVIYPGCRSSQLRPLDRTLAHRAWRAKGIDPETRTFCYFGRFGRFDALHTLARAAQKAQHARPDARFRVVLGGRGPHWGRMAKLARQFPQLMLPGWCNDAQIHALMQRSTLGLAPYGPCLAPRALPNKPVEYCAAGLGFVASSMQSEFCALAGAQEVAWSYEHTDDERLAQHLLAALDDPERCAQMGARAQALYQRHFRADAIAQRLSATLTALREASLRSGSSRPHGPRTETAWSKARAKAA